MQMKTLLLHFETYLDPEHCVSESSMTCHDAGPKEERHGHPQKVASDVCMATRITVWGRFGESAEPGASILNTLSEQPAQ